MKFVLCVTSIFLMYQTKTFAANNEPLRLGSDITYKRIDEKKNDAYPEGIDAAISHAAFIKLVGNGLSSAPNSLDLMNRIYIPEKFGTTNDDRLIMALSGISITGTVKYEQLYETGTGYIVHFKTNSSGAVALFFKGFSAERVQIIKDEISKNLKSSVTSEFKLKSWKTSALQSVFLQKAYAADTTSRCSITSGTSSNLNRSMNATVMEKLWTCTKGFAGGVWDATGGVGVSLVKGIAHPIDTFNGAADYFKMLGSLLTDFNNGWGDLKSAFDSLPILEQGNLLCETVAAVGTSTLITFFTLGAGSASLFRTLSNAALALASKLPAGSPTALKVAALATSMAKKAASAQAKLDILANEIPELKAHLNLMKNKPYFDPKLHGPLTPEFAAMQKKDFEYLESIIAAKRRSTNLSLKEKAAFLAYGKVADGCLMGSFYNSANNSNSGTSKSSNQTAPAAR